MGWDLSELKEFHFHVYFFQNNKASRDKAHQLRKDIEQLTAEGHFVAVPLKNAFNEEPRGPHPCGSFEVWCPREYLSQVLSFFILNRRGLSILIHPLSRHEVLDHTERSMWLGTPYPLDITALQEELDEVPFQYPELGLGYSAK
ncbi:hypothetical protein K493DRAFT_322095 [Basidiobolus meristosporus CBS 931.73]|uniref:Dopa 4,5-dioxygenase n=1 Tax=Basidiobolus meristosporus CBS 931.73 TaxID=1314790 RepID=A0A1Y1VQV8_9FUNG|nr:hypothetical protein K493DRAFT_322095 [Basidiobolus meristosporus CBS 931.73]|eukprot:ORX63660.1 hypothetical protein K493DRAFT_322095 [Basidiobolus meristosporus CBS 931.73]